VVPRACPWGSTGFYPQRSAALLRLRQKTLCALSQETGLTRSKADQIVELFFGEMANALATGDRVEIRGLCSFSVMAYKGHGGRNPKAPTLRLRAAQEAPFLQMRQGAKRKG